MKLRNVFLAAAGALALTLAACGSNSDDRGNASFGSESSSLVEPGNGISTNLTSYPLTLKTYDNSSNEVSQTYNEVPTRVICNNVSSAKTMIDLGLEKYIIGMPNPDNEVSDSYKEKIDAITKLGDKKTLSKEVILNYEPDIIIGRVAMFSSSSMGTVDELNSYDINVYSQAASIKTASIENIAEDIRNLGKIFNVQDKAEELALEVEEKVEALGSTNSTDYKNALVMCNFNNTTFGAYKSSLQEKMLNTIGYTNVATGTSGLSLENLVSMNPEIIIYVTADRNASVDATAVANLKSNDAISDVPAIVNNKIITVGYDDFMEYGANVINTLATIKASI